MDDVFDDNPLWLQKTILADAFKWENAFETTFEELFQYVTYHDSHWIGLFTNKYLEQTCIIRLDAFWNKEYSNYDEENQEWPFSIIKIENILSIQFLKHEICDSYTISTHENEVIDGVAISQFDDTCGGFIELTHKPKIKVLLINELGNYLNPNPITPTAPNDNN